MSLDETTGTRVDRVGNNDLEPVNAVTYQAGKVGNAAEFDFDNQTMLYRASEGGDLPQGAEPWTIALWCKPYNANQIENDYATIFHLRYGWWTGNFSGFRFQIKSDSVTSAFMYDGAGGAPYQSDPLLHRNTSQLGLLNTWIFAAFWYDGETFSAEWNRDGNIDTDTWRGMGTGGPRSVSIGGANWGSPVEDRQWLDGLVDEVGMWSRVLTSGELDTLYNSGAGLAYPFS